MIALWSLLPAMAHPLGESAATHTLSMVLHRDTVEVHYAVDVPNAFLIPRGPQPPEQAMAVELASGLLLTVDGQVLSMSVLPGPAPAPSSDHTVGFSVHLQAPLSGEARHLELSTANLQEASNLFAQDLRVEPGWRVSQASMLVRGQSPHHGGRIARDDTLRWRRGEDGRRLTVDLAGRWPGWWSWLVQVPDEPVRAARALELSYGDLRRPHVLTPNLWLASLLGAALMGVSTGRSHGLRASAVAALGLPLCLLPSPESGWVELITAGAAIVAWLATFRLPWVALGLLAAGWGATCHAPGPALGVLLAFSVGALARAEPHPRLAAAAVLLGLFWLLLRAEVA